MPSIQETRKEKITCFVMFFLLLGFYTATRALNQAESYDSINYALFAENFPLGTAPDSRNILFHIVNRSLFITTQWLGFEIRALELIVGLCVIAGAGSIVLFARLMRNEFGVSFFSAWAGALFLGVSYGFWRYTGAVEVYVPSIFLILCSLTLMFKSLQETKVNLKTLCAASVLSGVAVLYYQPNVLPLFFAASILFCTRSRLFGFASYCVVGGLVVFAGIVASYVAINDSLPSFNDLISFLTHRNHEFRARPPILIALVKSILAFGHDLYAAHWTRTLDPVRTALDPLIPGCIYNFNVVVFAGKGIEAFTAIAAVLLIPIAFLFARIGWIASKKWKLARPCLPNSFLLGWLIVIAIVVGTIDAGSFEAWIPMLIPFTGLLTVWFIEPCVQLGRKRITVALLLLTLLYNFFGGAMIWRNTQGDYFLHRTAWIRQELTEDDTVLLNEFDFRIVDYLNYYSEARVVHLAGSDQITISRSHPSIHSVTVDEFLTRHKNDKFRLFVLDDVLSPPEEIKSCRSGEAKFEAATELADRISENAVLVNSDDFGSTFQIMPTQPLQATETGE